MNDAGLLQPQPVLTRRARALLLAGMIAGIGAAAASLVAGRAGMLLPTEAVARVEDRLILRADWERAVAAVESERRAPLSADERRRVLDRLIDEELLVQQGLRLGLVSQDRRLRGQLVQEVMATVAQPPEPDLDTLRRHFGSNRGYFAGAGRLRVAALRVKGPPARSDELARTVALDAVRRLRAGEDFERVEQALGDELLPPLPADALPPAKLQAYLGPSLTRAAQALGEGEVSEPLVADGGYVVLQLLARAAEPAPRFEEIEAQVREDYRRRADEQAVRALLAELRRGASLSVRGGE